MSCSNPLRIKYTNKSDSPTNILFTRGCSVLVMCACMIAGQHARAAGGCGSVCLPLAAAEQNQHQLRQNQYRVGLITEHAKFDNFREGNDDTFNMGGNKAFITQTTLFVDYSITERITASILLPYIRKRQVTNKFGTRIAEGLGDVSLFGRYKILNPVNTTSPSVSMGLGIKFPTGSISEPDDSVRLPPAFQTGSGAYDIVPTIAYAQNFDGYSISANAYLRLPLEENRRGYKFGNEIELNTAIDYLLPSVFEGLSVSLGVSYLHAGHDRDSAFILPSRLRDGSRVLNSGGEFIDIIPGVKIKLSNALSLQANFSIPVVEDWNGRSSANVGQVAQDITTQFNLVYTTN